MTPLERVTARANRDGDANAPSTPRPLLTLEEFFDGNDAVGSICCNLAPTPSPSEVRSALERIRARPDVSDVRVQITMFDDPSWPFSDTVWVITGASAADVASWFDEALAPDECSEGWTEAVAFEPVAIPAGSKPVACWWD